MSSGPTSPSEDNLNPTPIADSAGIASLPNDATDATIVPREAPDTVARQAGTTTARYRSWQNGAHKDNEKEGKIEDENLAESTLDKQNFASQSDDEIKPEYSESEYSAPDASEYSTPDIPPLEPMTPPPDGPGPGALAQGLPEPDPSPKKGEQELDIFEHLGELRQRILYCVAATMLGLVVTWNFGTQLTEWFTRPIRAELERQGAMNTPNTLITIDPTEAFVVYLQITLVASLLLVMPFILFQLWRFIEPALTVSERRYGLVLVPFAVILFFTGVALGYVMSPYFFRFFLAFQPPGIAANFGYGKSAALLAKMLLVFGVCFQVPVITIFLHKIGLVTRNVLIEYWRHVFVVIFMVVAVLTPTWDPFTLIVCAGPPCALYVLSIWLIKWL